MFASRRAAMVCAGLLGTVLALGGATLWATQRLRARVIASLERRTGMSCGLGSVHIRLSGLGLEHVALRSATNSVSLRQVAVQADWRTLIGDGLDGVRRIDVSGGRVWVEGPLNFAARASNVHSYERFAHTSLPAVFFRDLQVEIRDQHGSLVNVASVSASLENDRVRVVADHVVLGGGSHQEAHLARVELEGSSAERTIDAFSATSVQLRLRDPGSIPPILGRLRAMAPGEGGTDRSDERSTRYHQLAPGFLGRVEGLSVTRQAPDGEHMVLERAHFRLERKSDSSFSTMGNGRPEGGGTLSWNLLVDVRAFVAEGSLEFNDVPLATLEPLFPVTLPLHRPERTLLSGALRLAAGAAQVDAVGELQVRELALESPRIGSAPVDGIEFSAVGHATFDPTEGRFLLERVELGLGGSRAYVSGSLQARDEHFAVEMRVEVPTSECGELLASIPKSALAELDGFRLSGRMGGNLFLRMDSRRLQDTELTIRIADGCRFEEVPPAADLNRFTSSFLHRVEEPNGSLFEATMGPGSDDWVPIEQISPFFIHAVLAHEDAGFFAHSGFSVGSIRQALIRNFEARRYVLGASTITMQLVKNVFLRREKTLVRKLQEVLLTWWVESAWTKTRILELYLNAIEYGPHVYGVRRAAAHYFGLEANELTPAQSAFLASILPNPPQFHSFYESGALSGSFRHRLERFLRLLEERGRYDSEATSDGLSELSTFRFAREGSPIAPRHVEGGCAPLPLELTGSALSAWDEELDGVVAPAENFE